MTPVSPASMSICAATGASTAVGATAPSAAAVGPEDDERDLHPQAKASPKKRPTSLFHNTK
jgi:hypothetical protein